MSDHWLVNQGKDGFQPTLPEIDRKIQPYPSKLVNLLRYSSPGKPQPGWWTIQELQSELGEPEGKNIQIECYTLFQFQLVERKIEVVKGSEKPKVSYRWKLS